MKYKKIINVFGGCIILFGTTFIVIGYIISLIIVPSTITKLYQSEVDKNNTIFFTDEYNDIVDEPSLESIDGNSEKKQLLYELYKEKYGERSTKKELLWMQDEIVDFSIPYVYISLIVLAEFTYLMIISNIKLKSILKKNLISQMNDMKE